MQRDSTLLIIDDEEDICLLLERILNKYFKTVVFSHTLAEGLAAFEQVKPTHVLLDNNMPDGYGLDQVVPIKQAHPGVILVIISALDIQPLALALGADAFVSKPLRMSLVKQALGLM